MRVIAWPIINGTLRLKKIALKEYSIVTLAVATTVKLFAKLLGQFLDTFQASEDYSATNSHYINTYIYSRRHL